MKKIFLLFIVSIVTPILLYSEEVSLMYYKGNKTYAIKKDIVLSKDPEERAKQILDLLLISNKSIPDLKTYLPEDSTLHSVKVEKEKITIVIKTENLPPPDEVVQYDEMQKQIINTLSEHLKGITKFDLRFLNQGKILTIDEAVKTTRKIKPKDVDSCNILRLNSKDAPTGTLTGKRIVVSPGHGYYYNENLGWITQRDNINGLIEDLLTADICNNWLIPYLERAGAHVISVRERDFSPVEFIMDNSSPQGYEETGKFDNGSSPGGYADNYRVALTDTQNNSSVAEYTINLPTESFFRVSIWWVPGNNRAEDTPLILSHSGGETTFLINQRIGTPTWFYLPSFYFSEKAIIRIGNLSSKSGDYIVADAVRLGGGMGSISRGGKISGKPRWQEAARYFVQYAGAPTSVYDASSADNNDDVISRPKYADWAKADLYISVHTNAYNNSATGTETYYYSGQIFPGSNELAALIQKQIISDIRKEYDPNWTDRGVKSANFGELRECTTMPSALTELAFHDGTVNVKDNEYLHDTKFKKLMGRAVYRGIAKFFNGNKPFIPEPPQQIYAESPIPGVLRVSWGTVEGASGYRVYISRDGYGFDNGTPVDSNKFELKCLKPGLLFVKVTATNEGGESLDSQILAVTIQDIRGWKPILIVNAFDRLDATVQIEMNRGNWIIPHAKALFTNGYFFESATNEAFVKEVDTSQYIMIDWLSGLESTRDETFNRDEQKKIIDFLAKGGSLFVSGSEIAWDLDFKGDADDKKFFSDWLRASYLADSSGVYKVLPTTDSIFKGISEILFDDGTHGIYPVRYADVLNPINGSKSELLYDQNKGTAAIQFVGAYKIIYFGFPFESIYSEETRSEVMKRIANFMVGDIPNSDIEVDYSCCNPSESICIDDKRYKQCSISGTFSIIKTCESGRICKDGSCILNQDLDGGLYDDIQNDTFYDATEDTMKDVVSEDTSNDTFVKDTGVKVCNNGERICDRNNVKVCVKNEWYIGSVCGVGTICINGICVAGQTPDSGIVVESDSSGCGCAILE
ncbi:MAG: N-acetylmuramoyl-L-alanine amidase [Deltaproteobacteria bacterium]|nr:N-acetylmuramoyl-L-alanine amidase [Deltaproteobacteria bacterium]